MASLGTDFMVQRNFFKRYPCNRGIFQGLDAVAALATRTHIAADEVEAVIVRLAPTSAWMVNNPAPPQSSRQSSVCTLRLPPCSP